MSKNIDLHIHTCASSDGNISPEAIVDSALALGLCAIAITDHNTTAGTIKAETYMAENAIVGLELISGIELDCQHEGTNLHLLGYFIDAHMAQFEQHARDMYDVELAAGIEARAKIERFFGIALDDGIFTGELITAEAIAEELLLNPQYNHLKLLDPYRMGGSRSDNPYVNFYWDYCSQGKVAYSEMALIDLSRAIEMIESAGGIPVLAHPGINIHEDEALLGQIVRAGIKGIEAISSYHSKAQVAFYREAAQKWGLAVTCGSDFHGKIKPAIQLGHFDAKFDAEALLTSLRRVTRW